jgi:nitroreductase
LKLRSSSGVEVKQFATPGPNPQEKEDAGLSKNSRESKAMEVFDAIRTVLAVRAFEDKPVPDEIVDRIVEAGRLTASAMNKQPWHFIVVKDRARIEELGRAIPSGRYVSSAAFAVAVAIERSPLAISDGSRAIQDMVLTAWSEGVGSNWVGFIGMLDGVATTLKVPDDLQLLAVVPFGYPAKQVGKGKKERRTSADVVSLEEFGTSYRP